MHDSHLSAYWLDRLLTVEGLVAAVTLGWGVWLIAPWDTFSTNPAYSAMAALPEWVWGAGMLLAGLGVWGMLLLRRVRLTALFLAACTLIWVFVTGMLIMSNPRLTGVPGYFCLSVWSGAVLLRYYINGHPA